MPKIKLRRGTLGELKGLAAGTSPVDLDIGEVGVTLDTKELFVGTNEGNINLTDRSQIFMPTDFSDKTHSNNFWVRTSGPGPDEPTFDVSDSAIGRGCLLFPTGTSGVWNTERYYPVSPLVGIGGHFCIKGIGNFKIGVDFYNANKGLLSVPGGDDQRYFMTNTAGQNIFSGTLANWTLFKGYLQGDGGTWNATTNRCMPAGTRFIRPRIEIVSNGNAKIDGFIIYPSSPFAMIATYV